MNLSCEHTEAKKYTVLTVGTNRPLHVCRDCFYEMYGVYPDANNKENILCVKKKLPKPLKQPLKR